MSVRPLARKSAGDETGDPLGTAEVPEKEEDEAEVPGDMVIEADEEEVEEEPEGGFR